MLALILAMIVCGLSLNFMATKGAIFLFQLINIKLGEVFGWLIMVVIAGFLLWVFAAEES